MGTNCMAFVVIVITIIAVTIVVIIVASKEVPIKGCLKAVITATVVVAATLMEVPINSVNHIFIANNRHCTKKLFL